MRNKVHILLITVLCLSTSCKINFTSLPKSLTVVEDSPAPTVPPIDPDAFTSTVLSSEPFSARTYDLVKAQSGSNPPTYMQWIENDTSTTAGAVIIYYPYEGINWTGEAIDAKWAARADGGYPDEDGPDYNVSTSSQISYTAMPHLTAAQNASQLTFNKLHVLIVYGRYYTGTTVAGDVAAVKDAYRFLNTKTVVDKTKIGIYSGSWGGVGVLYGSKAAAAYNLKPKVISLAYPVSDLKALTNYIDSIPTKTAISGKQAQYAAFFDPYRRRIDKATEALTGQANRYDKYTPAELSAFDAATFVIHDSWDTLVPVTLTPALFTAMPSADKYAYYQRHITPIDFDTFIVNHSQVTNPVDYPTALTWNYLFLVTQLTDPAVTRVASYSYSAFTSQFQYMKAMHDAAQDTSAFNKTLGLLCSSNLFMNNVDTSNFIHGGSYVLWVMMETYYQSGWSADGTAACAKLITNPPF